MPFSSRLMIFLVSIILAVIYLYSNTQPQMMSLSLHTPNNDLATKTITVALVADLHIKRSPDAILGLEELWSSIIEQAPDVILLAGDYINDGNNKKGIETIGPQIAGVFSITGTPPVIAVLGNHDYWSDSEAWRQYLSDAGVIVLENEIVVLDGVEICIRGFGDAFTGNFRYVDFPDTCRGKLSISLMHDPAGAFYPNVRGIVLAGHTHCGQVSIPFIGPIYTPSSAPKNAQCGLFQDKKLQLFVNSGVGTSILPLRINTQSSWELITIYY